MKSGLRQLMRWVKELRGFRECFWVDGVRAAWVRGACRIVRVVEGEAAKVIVRGILG